MAKAELGTKRICPVTGRKFYDLNKDPVVSPFTGESYPRSYFEPAVRGSSRAEPRGGAVEEAEPEDTEAEVISLEEADEEASAPAKVVVGDDVDVDDDIEAGDDDTFLEEDEDDGDDVSDLIGEGLEDDEEA
ncbi:TIGR02300 family protein [Xanthobacter oligotrophicus]|uniref:TIGR02300 family protein n=1 Tax=Xanthobacter oligotrophicus TaxID=2607286 RepID=A0ABW6ZTT3_9HYPH|nr:TIGR02300 family protein [Xanthobacter oligotrophicus]MCG5237099.1 TIGR02300 family protein [Xanthobacter oligotrophicus]